MQPYFLPYIGYWQLMKIVDKYVVYDDVNYIKGGWINRNNFLIGGEKRLITILLNGASPFKLINEIDIKDDFGKFLKTIQFNYSKAPYYREVMTLVESVCTCSEKNLALFLFNSFSIILSYLDIHTELILSSSLKKDCSLKGKEKVINICELLCADSYLNAIGGQLLYDKDEFKAHQINLKFLKTHIMPYTQFSESFVPGLSILDVLMFNSPAVVNSMLDKFERL